MRRNNQQQQQQGMRGGGMYDDRAGGGGGNRDQPRRGGGGDRGGNGGGGGGGGGELPVYGIVISMKEVFGFLQPLLPIPGEEHLYFNDKDVFGERLQEGDEVQFVVRAGPRGLVAAQVRRLEGGVKVKKAKVLGVVEQEADQYKFSPGLLSVARFPQFSPEGAEVEVPEDEARPAQMVPYMPVDVSKSSRRLMKGDEVQFDLYLIPQRQRQRPGGEWRGYSRGHDICLVRTRNDRLIAEQVQQLEAAGVAREQGVLDTIKNDFGFVRPADRQEQVFFRLEDVLDTAEHLPNEGDEVEFYVIRETVKGRESDRAVHLKYLPHGTVQFEETLGSAMRVVVVAEPRVQPREEPGLLQLLEPSDAQATGVQSVELWSRCLPEGMTQLKCGDELEVDVTKYRPEKLIFARNVKVSRFLPLGRVFGVISDLKASGGYGFIRPEHGDPDCYFRVSEMLEEGGSLMPERRVKVGMRVCYEAVLEDLRGGGSKLRAVRVQVCSEESFRPRKASLLRDLTGTVKREARKGDQAAGRIELTAEAAQLVEESRAKGGLREVEVSQPDMLLWLQDFRRNQHLQEVTVGPLSPYHRHCLHTLLRNHIEGVAHVTVDSVAGGGKKGQAAPQAEARVLSLTESNLNAVTNSVATASAAANAGADLLADYEPPANSKAAKKAAAAAAAAAVPTSAEKEDDSRWQEVRLWKIADPKEFQQWVASNEQEAGPRWTGVSPTGNSISFLKADVLGDLGGEGGGARAGTDVTFLLCVDRATGALVAADVKMSDVQAEDGAWPQLGSVDFLRAEGGEVGGYVRRVPGDEKLMWSQPATAAGAGAEAWQLGSAVSFEVRVRGGVRYAAGVALVLPGSDLDVSEVEVLEGWARGVVVEAPAGATGGLAVQLLDTSACPAMKNKIVDMAGAVQAVRSKKLVQGAGTFQPSDTDSWEKKDLEAKAKAKDSNKAAATATVAAGVAQIDKPEAPLPTLYPPLPVAVLPIGEGQPLEGLAVGALVKCRLAANFLRQRLPLYVLDVAVLPADPAHTVTLDTTGAGGSTGRGTSLANLCEAKESSTAAPAAGRVKGTIVRLKINTTMGFHVAEISLSEQYRRERGTVVADDAYLYYCDSRELQGQSQGRGHQAYVGDVVDFVPAPVEGVAAAPVVAKASTRSGQMAAAASTSRRSGVSSSLMSSSLQQGGVKSITMAEGPQGDSIGFAAGWRGAVDVQVLPWGHLLGHLQQQTLSS